MNVGFVADRIARYETAARYDAAALASDTGRLPPPPTTSASPSPTSAGTTMRWPRCAALGWFNLGVVHGRMGPLHLLA
jgi:hypothetical protein